MTTKKPLRILGCGDIHFHHYNNGVTLSDVITVGEQFVGHCRAWQPDVILLLGDYALSRNPMAEVHFAIARWLKDLSSSGIPVVCLIGNHDRIYKSNFKTHMLTWMSFFPNDLKNIKVVEEVRSEILNLNGTTAAIHCVPAGHEVPKFKTGEFDYDVMLFHGMVKGSLYQNGIPAKEGMEVNSLDQAGMNLILGGDNHRPQKLVGFKNDAWYAGAPMQHNWSDSGDDNRGFFQAILNPDGTKTVSGIKSGAPKFIKQELRVETLEELSAFMLGLAGKWQNNIINLKLLGPSSCLKDIDVHDWSQKIKSEANARAVSVKLQYDLDRAIHVSEKTKSDHEEWQDYIKTLGASQVGDLDPEKLEKLGLEYINA